MPDVCVVPLVKEWEARILVCRWRSWAEGGDFFFPLGMRRAGDSSVSSYACRRNIFLSLTGKSTSSLWLLHDVNSWQIILKYVKLGAFLSQHLIQSVCLFWFFFSLLHGTPGCTHSKSHNNLMHIHSHIRPTEAPASIETHNLHPTPPPPNKFGGMEAQQRIGGVRRDSMTQRVTRYYYQE